jgi:exodeoxyribonuclease V alpha subunit
LTSVGPGQFLKDLCASPVPRIELTHIYRSGPDSFIATNGQKIRHGDTSLDTAPSSFEVLTYQNEEQIVSAAIVVAEQTGDRPMVLCNTNQEIANLNRLLRQHFNPPAATVTSKPVNLEYVSSTAMFRYQNWRFALGDSVINVTNKYKEVADGAGTKTVLQVANGDIGTVGKITPDAIWVRYSEAFVKYEGPIDYNEYLRPAYALTVNKAQGSEYNVVIVKSVSSWGDKRERFYTAVTRAKQKCIIYEVGTANNDCIRAAPATRKTFLFKR